MKLLKHLEKRGMKPNFYDLHVNEDEGVVSFYLYNFSFKLVGYHQYRPNGDKKKKMIQNLENIQFILKIMKTDFLDLNIKMDQIRIL